MAGGTDLMVELGRGTKPAARLIDLTALDAELRFVESAPGRLTFGALTTHNDVLRSSAFRRDALPLVQACAEVGAPQIRARGTIAGNVVTASPANDTITALVALEAELDLVRHDGRRRLHIDEFCTGFRTTALRPGELVRAISIRPLGTARRGIFLKLGLRRAQAIAVINVAVVLGFERRDGERSPDRAGLRRPDDRARASTPRRRSPAARSAAPRSPKRRPLAAAAAVPIDDVRASASYRRTAVAALVERALERIADGTEAPVSPTSRCCSRRRSCGSRPNRSRARSRRRSTAGRTELEDVAHLSLLDALRDAPA